MSIQQGITGASGGTSSNFGSSYPSAGTAAGAKDSSGNMAALNLDANGQLKAAANLRNSSGVEIATLANPVRVDPVGTTAQPAAQSGTWTVQPGNTPNSTPWLVSLIPAAAGGLSSLKLVSAASTNATSVKTSAGQLFNVQAFNTSVNARYLKLYNKASAPSVGVDTPVATWLIPASSSGFIIEISNGMNFSAGIAFAITALMNDADTTAVGAQDVVVNLQYK